VSMNLLLALRFDSNSSDFVVDKSDINLLPPSHSLFLSLSFELFINSSGYDTVYCRAMGYQDNESYVVTRVLWCDGFSFYPLRDETRRGTTDHRSTSRIKTIFFLYSLVCISLHFFFHFSSTLFVLFFNLVK
jgi:hypothetical protein